MGRQHSPVHILGDAILDIVFEGDPGDPTLQGAVGGGTAHNVACNMASRGLPVHAQGVAGDDWRGDLACRSLHEGGVSYSIERISGKLTRAIFVVPDQTPKSSLLDQSSPFTLRGDCVICDRPAPTKRVASRDPEPSLPAEPGLLFADRVSQAKSAMAREARAGGWWTALDVGRTGYIRYLPTDTLAGHLSSFDIILLSERVSKVALTKLDASDWASLMQPLGISVMLVTAGPRGLSCTEASETGVHEWSLPTPHASFDVVDDIGAGDAFAAGFLGNLAREGRPQSGLLAKGKAVALAEQSMLEVGPKLRSLGARGHLGLSGRIHRIPRSGERLSTLRSQIDARSDCEFCGAGPGPSPTRRTVGSRTNVSLVQRRVASALRQSEAVDTVAETLRHPGLTVCVGAGGSYPAASLAALTINRHGLGIATAMRPMEYLQTQPNADSVLAVSYSGGSPDIEQVLMFASDRKVDNLVLLTAAHEPRAAARVNDCRVAAYGSPTARSERGFVSIAATVAPSAIVAAAICGHDAVLDLRGIRGDDRRWTTDVAAALAFALDRREPVEVFATAWAWPALLDIESKLTEGGLGVARLHESKDFSHGRFMAVLDKEPRPTALHLCAGPLDDFSGALRRTLADHTLLTSLDSDEEGVLGGLDLLGLVQHVVVDVAQQLGRDISRPPAISEDGLRLYRWKGSLGGHG